jgi:hypothetical protein
VNYVRLHCIEALLFAITGPIAFSLLHYIDGTRPLVTEFETGGIVGVVLLKCIEAIRAYMERCA